MLFNLTDIIEEFLRDLQPHPIDTIVNVALAKALTVVNLSDQDLHYFTQEVYEATKKLVMAGKAEFVHGKNVVKGLPTGYKGMTDALPECPVLFELFNGTIINLTHIVTVSPVVDKVYTVHFINGRELDILEERMYRDEARTKPTCYAPRERLIAAWKEALNMNARQT